MIRAAFLLLLAPVAASAQLALFAVTGATETPLGTTYQVGTVAAGDSKDIRLRARNSGAASISVTRLGISGSGFSITQTPSVPFVIASGAFQDIFVHFAGGAPASYSANFQVNSVSVLLMAVVTPVPSLSVGKGCTGPDPNNATITFGSVTAGQTAACAIVLANQNGQSVTVSKIAVIGNGFQLAQTIQTPIVLATGGSFTFTINFVPASAALYSATLTVDARSFPLAGTAVSAPLPAPLLEFDAGAPASGQQRTLTMRLPSPAPVAVTGSVTLTFQPDTTLVADDPAVAFVATGARSVGFSINAGDTQFTLGGKPGAVFQTGTTSGKIRFSISTNAVLTGTPSAAMTIPPAAVGVDNATATRRAGDLDVQVWGFDNTYSTGAMGFTFYDAAGHVLGQGPVQADFSAPFRSYFAAAKSGSAFQMRVSFPVIGDASQVGAVDVQITNAAGNATIQHLPFQ